MCGGRFSIARALVHQRVAGAHGGADLRHQQAALARHLQNFAERNFEVLLDVVAERLERRDVEYFGAVLQISGERLADQTIDAGEKRRQRLAGSGGRGDQRGASRQDVRPALLLRFGRRAEALREPFLDERMRPGERAGNREGHSRYFITGVWVSQSVRLAGGSAKLVR